MVEKDAVTRGREATEAGEGSLSISQTWQLE